MKRILSISILSMIAVCLCILAACKKETNQYPSHTATVSFPVVTLVGPQDTTINRGATWVDPGATWRDSVTGETGTLKAHSINTSVDSAYMLVYTATNKNGFQMSVVRGLGVTNMGNATDISGSYTVNGAPATVNKVARALFSNSNADGFGGGDSTVMVIKSDSTISIATIGTEITGTVGAPVPETFTQASILYQAPYYYSGTPPHLTAQPPVIISYVATILNVGPVSVTMTHN